MKLSHILIFKIYFNLFYYPVKLLVIGTKCMLRHQDLQIFGLKSNKVEHFAHLKLWVVEARNNYI